MPTHSPRFRILLLLLLFAGVSFPGQAEPLRFFAVGDIPYRDAEKDLLASLFDAAVTQHTPFLVHLGDIKAGSTPCTDAGLDEIAGIFRAQPVPVVYSPGDNEWTDCHRLQAGNLDPLKRLDRLREVFFARPDVLRLGQLGEVRRLKGGLGSAYPEVYSFMRDGVMFVVLHVVGSNNNHRKGNEEAIAEFHRRNEADLDLLHRSAELARQRKARALVLLFHADPLFEQTKPPKGFAPIRKALVRLMSEYPGPVLLIHGDSHTFRHDHPLSDPETGTPLARFTRVEVPGSPFVGGLWITIDPDAVEPIGVEPVYASALGSPNGGE